jgi:poly-gamma-glutamate capsule biosynthesis protein CapA/YwtB (metallophosphatase superfamily)
MLKPIVKIFLAGDVMTGRGIDQLLKTPAHPQLYESCIKDARGYVRLAETHKKFTIQKPVPWEYIWGDSLAILEEMKVDFRIINLETSVTRSEDPWPNKGIHYKMHPQNIPCLKAAKIDVVSLANNHVLDWGYAGLEETLQSLHDQGIQTVGAGLNLEAATQPALLKKLPGTDQERRVLVFALGSPCSGIPAEWAATPTRAGVNYLPDFSPASIEHVKQTIERHRQAGDIVIVSVHWGGNWGHEVPEGQRRLAHALASAGVDVVFGHSSHHAKEVEKIGRSLVLYGCGDFINDYEGIDFDRQGHDNDIYRADLARVYVAECDDAEVRLRTATLKMDRFRLNLASAADDAWMKERFGPA